MRGSFSLLLYLSVAVVNAISPEDDLFEIRTAVEPDSSNEPRAMAAPNTGSPETSYPCKTRKKVECDGILVSKCAKLYPLYLKVGKATASEAEKDVLRDAFCGFKKFNEHVMCCELDSSNHPSGTLDKHQKPLQCGKNPLYKTVQRVVGGQPATLGAWPWMAALYVLNIYTGKVKFRCGGSLIGSEWVLTAAHCIPTKADEILVSVRLGDLDLNATVQDGANPINRTISLTIIHPKYSREKVLNDIALLRLQEPVKYTDYIRPICIRRSIFVNESTYLKMKPTIIGWGGKYFGDQRPPTHLQEVDLDVVSHKECSASYVSSTWNNQMNVEKTNLCASGPGQDSCQGDSGGPLMFLESDRSWTQGGIVSFGKGCAQPRFPGVYTKVSSYIDWINQKTGLNF